MLTNYTRLLGPSLGSFIADGILPSVDVPSKTGKFYDVAGGFASAAPGHDLIIADGQDSPLQISTSISKVTGWDVNVNGLGVKMNKSSAEYAQGNGLDLRKANAAVLARECLIQRERTAAALAFNTSVFSGYTAALSGTDQWDNAASDPISKAQDARDTIITNSGETPNTAIMGYEVYKNLRSHPLILEWSSRTANTVGILTNDDLARALDVDTIWVGKAVANADPEGVSSAGNAFIWGKFCLFAHIKSSPAAMTPQSCLQRFRFAGSTDGAVRRWEPTPYVEQIDMLWNDQMAAPTVKLGYLYSTVVS
jgi:hypothetical protein